MDVAELEGVAAYAHAESGIGDGPIDAFDLVAALEMPLVLEPGSGGRRSRGAIRIGTNTPVRRFHSVIAHECAHELLDRCRLVNDEPSANYLGAALLVSRPALIRQSRAGWHLYDLMGYHVNASAELLARRLVEIRGGSVAIYDRGRVRRRFGSPPADELALVNEVLATAAPARVDDVTGAWPVFRDGWRRVIVLSQTDADTI